MKMGLRLALAFYIVMLGSEEYFKGPGLTYLFGVILFGTFLLALILRAVKIKDSGLAIPVVLLTLFAMVSIIWSLDPDRTLYFAFLMFQLLLSMWITVSCIERESDLNLLVWALLFSSVFPAWSLVTGYMAHGSQLQQLMAHEGRLSLGQADPNLTAYRFVVSILAAIHLFMTTRSFLIKVLVLGLAGLCAGASLLTGSRGGAIAMVVSIAVLLASNFQQRKGPILAALAGIAIFLAVAVPFLPASVTDRYAGIHQEVTTGTMAARKVIYREAGASFEKRPILGVGYFAFSTFSAQHGGLGKAAHNDPLEITVDLGITGLLIYLIHVVTLLWGAAATPLPWKGFTLGMFVAYAVASLSITLLAAKLPWITFGVIFGAVILLTRTRENLPAPGAAPWTARGVRP